MKLFHLADLHGNRERADELLQSLARAKIAAAGVDLIAIAGDVWDSVIQNTAGSRFVEIAEAIRSLADVAPVVLIYGTPTHDADGSLDVFPTLDSIHGITVLSPGTAYFLTEGRRVFSGDDLPLSEIAAAVVFGVPEPSKKWLAPNFDSKVDAETAVRGALRGLFAGLGAMRRKYPQLPCVMLYHGQVAGARLQNGDLMEAGSGLRPSIDDLAAVGADYIAMGDIHEPQRVGETIGLPAYYPGSAYPINFGETHEAGGNLVEISVGAHSVTRAPFGHPVNQTIRVLAESDLMGVRVPDFKAQRGARLKVEVTCTQEQKPLIDWSALETLVGGMGAPGSVVVPNVLPTETVRAGDIVAKKALRDKVTLWGENSKKEIPASVLAKADDVEAEAAQSGAVGRGQKIVLNRLILRGSIGLKKKSGLDEVDIDLTTIDPGLVALIGGNGAGKTTILENMHPWPELLTRDGTLKSHFYLRDSFRDLRWTDEASGAKYRTLILINGAVESASTEYYLYADTGDGMQPLPGIEGRKEGYVEAVDRLFGSKDLYLRSAFVTQRQPKGLPDLADATPGQRKALFSALCGTDYLEVFKTIAKARGDALDSELDSKRVEITTLESRLVDPSSLETERDAHSAALESAHEDLAILAEVGKHKATQVEALAVTVNTNERIKEQAAESTRLSAASAARAVEAMSGVADAETAVRARGAAVQTIVEYDQATASIAAHDQAYQKHLEAQAAEQAKFKTLRDQHDDSQRAARTAFDDAVRVHGLRLRSCQSDEQQVREVVRGIDAELVTLDSLIWRLQVEMDKPLEDHCSICRQLLPEEARQHVLLVRAGIATELNGAKKNREGVLGRKAEAETALTTATQIRTAYEANAPIAPELPAFVPPESSIPEWNDTVRSEAKTSLVWINVDQAREIVANADRAAVRIEELKKQYADHSAAADRERAREKDLRSQLSSDLSADLDAARKSLEACRTQCRETQGTEARAAAALDQIARQLEAAIKDRQQIDGLKTALSTAQAELAEWRLLEFACSDKGIQALELDAVAPSIAAIANELLKGTFGTRYQLEFQTTRLSGTGKAQKQIEDFLVQVLDTETGESQEIATLSGGEAVWIRRALYDAFGLIRARSTGLHFLTVFQDEADGQLDPVQRLTYFRMLLAAHAQAGRRHTILITHSQEIQELVPARIEVTKLHGRQEKEAA